ncbi:MAG: pitrilysin family protein [Woeseiaceae bacterium]|nr:pitrilysin family protein [Woeseiaceae bacterium]
MIKRLLAPLLVLFTLPALAASTVDIPFERFMLDNGLRVIVHEDRKAPIVAVGVWYHVGSKDEKPGKTGFAHLFEHLMFNGSENYDDEYFKPFEEVGATGMNGTTWFDRTNYFQNVPTPALEMALWMESDRMGHLLGAVTQEKLDNQRGVVQNEKRQGDNQPYGLVEYHELEGLFPEGHPYRWSTIGSLEDLDAASLEDVKEWFRENYGAANTVLVLAGDIDAAEARPLVEKYFGNIEAGPPLAKRMAYVPEKSTITREQLYDRVPQARVYRSWVVPGRTTETRAELDLAASVLGSGKNSRLYKALVYDARVATSVSASVEAHELASIFRITATLQPGGNAAEVSRMIDEVLADFLAGGPGKEELERAKTKINAGFIRGVEQVGGFSGKASALAQGELYAGDPGFYRTRLGWLNDADAADVQGAAATWLGKAYHQIDVLPYPQYTTTGVDADRSALPVVRNTPDLVFPEIQRDELRNGIEIVLAERSTVPVVNIAMQFDAGFAADAGGTLGTANFTLAMMDEGTKERSALEISAESESLGAQIGTGSNLDTSTVSLSAIRDQLEPSLALYADVVRNPAFAQDEMDRLRQRLLAQIEQEKNQPVGVALRTLPPIMYGDDHAYGIPFTGSGTSESVASLTRDDLVGFHQTWLRPDNATIFVVGDVTMDEIKPMLEKQFGNWKTPRTPLPTKNIAAVERPEAPTVYLVDKPGAPQSLILAGHVAPPEGVDNNLAIQTMNDVIGGQFTARVNMNLREDKGWAYGAYTLIYPARGQRPFMVYAPVQTDRTVDSIEELMLELNGFLDDRPATADELDRNVKNSVRSLPGQFETGGAVLGALMSNARFGRPDDYVTTLKEEYEGLGVDDLNEAASDVIHPQSLTWMIVGDLEEIEQSIRDMNLGEVKVITAN